MLVADRYWYFSLLSVRGLEALETHGNALESLFIPYMRLPDLPQRLIRIARKGTLRHLTVHGLE